jgi:hypothetical protein
MMIRGLLARPGAGPGSRTVIPGPVRLTSLPGSGSFCGIRIVKSTLRDFARRVREFRDEKAE